MVRVLHVMWEDLHINTVEAVNEDGLRQAARIFSGERLPESQREMSSWFH